MKVAVIGAGLSGLATAWFFSDYAEVTLFDHQGIGGGASGAAAGLLHPYAGKHAKPNRDGQEALASTRRLIHIASEALGEDVAEETGILRLATTDSQIDDFKKTSKYPDVVWWDAEQCQEQVPAISHYPGIFIKSGITVHTEKYLQGLWLACKKKGVQFIQKNIERLTGFDAYVLATGYEAQQHTKITPIKGQVLELVWPKELPPLPFSVNSQAYIMMLPDKKQCLVGATFERNFSNRLPEQTIAEEFLLPKVQQLIPELQNAKIVRCRTGIRASSPNHLPIAKQIATNTWIITGMGSKGLLYHAYYAEKLLMSFCSVHEKK